MTKQNYQPGTFEAVADMQLTGTPTLNTWYHFRDTDWRYVLADVTLKQAGTAIPSAAFELAKDDKYTALEVGKSGKELYCQWRIVNATYAGISTTVSGNNFGSYVDNEKVQSRLAPIETFVNTFDAAEVSYDNATSGLTADNVQAAIDEVNAGMIGISHADGIVYDNATSGLTAADIQAAIDELDAVVDLCPAKPTLGAEVSALVLTDAEYAQTATVKIENPLTTHSNAQYAVVKITVTPAVYTEVTTYMSTSITGAEAYDTDWAIVVPIVMPEITKSVVLLLPLGLYRFYFNPTGSDFFSASVKYKIVNSGLPYA